MAGRGKTIVVDEEGRNIPVGIIMEKENDSNSSSSSKASTTGNDEGVAKGDASVAPRGGAKKFGLCNHQRNALAKDVP